VAPEVIHRKGELFEDRDARKGEVLRPEKVKFCVTPYKEVEPKERKEARARVCGWSGCAAPVCAHEVNFCATHASCLRCVEER
jgi:hypothetical protein